MAEVVEGCDYVVGVGWRWVDAATGPTVTLAFALIGKGYRRCTVTL
jgi:hypothetical protein